MYIQTYNIDWQYSFLIFTFTKYNGICDNPVILHIQQAVQTKG